MITHAYMQSGVSHPHPLRRQAAICAKSIGTCLEASPYPCASRVLLGDRKKGGEGGRRAKTKKRWKNGDLSEACVRRHTMLVSVPLLFLHVKKFLSPSEGEKN